MHAVSASDLPSPDAAIASTAPVPANPCVAACVAIAREVFVAAGTRGTGEYQLPQTPVQPSLADYQVVLIVERLQGRGKVRECLPKGRKVPVLIRVGGQQRRRLRRDRVKR